MEIFAASVRQAEVALRDLFEPTPLQKNDHLSAKYGAEIWLKREDLTPVRSYKLRGAFNAMRKVVARGDAAHFVCASAQEETLPASLNADRSFVADTLYPRYTA